MSNPTVKLLTWTKDPIETMYILWEASRNQDFTDDVENLKRKMAQSLDFQDQVKDLFLKILNNNIPIAENINFVFMIDNVSIALREQMVRHRVGVKVGERLGVDHVPDMHDSSWWSQTMRVLDMGKFADEKRYFVPDSIKDDSKKREHYRYFMNQVQASYNYLCSVGVPREEARMVLPIAAEHRISWSMNLATLSHILRKRSCWIAQLGLWESVIVGIVNEICSKVDPIFKNLTSPPCMKNNKFQGCKHELDSTKRCNGEDPLPPCPIYIKNNNYHHSEGLLEECRKRDDFQEQLSKFEKLWRS